MRMLLLAALTACTARDATTPPDAPADPSVVYLTPPQHLTRASLALRGIRPSLDELRAVAADPDQLPAIVDRYLAAPELAQTIQELENETLLLRVEQPTMTFPQTAALPTATAIDINGSVFDEPLRLIAD